MEVVPTLVVEGIGCGCNCGVALAGVEQQGVRVMRKMR